MILTSNDLAIIFHDFTDINNKIAREVKNDNLIKLPQRSFETNPNTLGKYLAGRVYRVKDDIRFI